MRHLVVVTALLLLISACGAATSSPAGSAATVTRPPRVSAVVFTPLPAATVPGASTAPTPFSAPAPSSPTPTPVAEPLPEGWAVYPSNAGFLLAIPKDWYVVDLAPDSYEKSLAWANTNDPALATYLGTESVSMRKSGFSITMWALYVGADSKTISPPKLAIGAEPLRADLDSSVKILDSVIAASSGTVRDQLAKNRGATTVTGRTASSSFTATYSFYDLFNPNGSIGQRVMNYYIRTPLRSLHVSFLIPGPKAVEFTTLLHRMMRQFKIQE